MAMFFWVWLYENLNWHIQDIYFYDSLSVKYPYSRNKKLILLF